MKIGIISAYPWLKKWDNYGTLLQNYALQAQLRQMGHESFWIRNYNANLPLPEVRDLAIARHPPHQRLATRLRWLAKTNLERIYNYQIQHFNRAHPRQFAAFFKQHIAHTPIEYSSEQLIANPPPADAYIVGSDQVWTCVTVSSFLAFGTAASKRIAYAASASWKNCNCQWFVQAKIGIQRFDAVSVREIDGIEICRSLGCHDVVQAVDPTMLLGRNQYQQLLRTEAEDKAPAQPFVLGYFLNVRHSHELPWDAMAAFAVAHGLKLKIVPLQGCELITPSEYVYTPTPAQWLNAYDKAACVLTNSFHGAVFAIIMQKPFLVTVQNGTTAVQNCRFYSLLEKFGLEQRILVIDAATDFAAITQQMQMPINWQQVGDVLARWKCESVFFLEQALTA